MNPIKEQDTFFKNAIDKITNELIQKYKFNKTRINEIIKNKDMTLKEASIISEVLNCSIFDLELFVRGYPHSIGYTSYNVINVDKIIINNDINLLKLLIRSDRIVNVKGVIYNSMMNRILSNESKNNLLKYLLKNNLLNEYEKLHKSNGSIFEDLHSLNLLDEYTKNYYLYSTQDFKKIIIPAFYTEQINSFKKEERETCVLELINILKNAYSNLNKNAKIIECSIFETNQNIYYDITSKFDLDIGRVILSPNELLKIKDLTNKTKTSLFAIINKFSKLVERKLL